MNNKLKTLVIFCLPVFFWMGVIFYLSSIPSENLPDIPIPYIHKIVHFIEYSILGILLIRAFKHSNPGMGNAKLIIISVVLIILFSLSDEWHQTFVPGRDGDLYDVLFDTIYSYAGIFLCSKMRAR